ncbi:TetR/AcrR family transcriptional regulator [Actinacidiphila glaucinigra]|uniref:TetR/AcrR family transcriptional regulator n=1 Tax=Actinacidiphila glaucinigra TaxID=235986 RepID=UPI0033AAEECA
MTDGGSLRERLVDAGVDLVLAGGTASVGLREIARRAGVSHGAPRRHFPTHDSLLSAIARRGFEDLHARFATATAGAAAPRAQLAAAARSYVGYALDHRGMFELMFRHDLLDGAPQADGGPRLRETSLPLFRAIVDLVVRCRAEQDAAAAAAAPPAAVTAAALWSNLHGLVQLWTWGSLQVVLGAEGPGAESPDYEQLVTAVIDAHLGPVPA